MHGDHVVRCAVQIARGPQSVTDVCCMAGGFLVFLFFFVLWLLRFRWGDAVHTYLGNPHGHLGVRCA